MCHSISILSHLPEASKPAHNPAAWSPGIRAIIGPLLSLRRSCTQVLELAQQLAPTAAQLLGAPKLRLYQDCTFLKNAGIGAVRYKHWHSRSLQRGFHETRRRSQPVLSCASGLQTPLVASIALYACTGFKCAGPAPEASLMTCTSRLSAQHFAAQHQRPCPHMKLSQDARPGRA